MKLPCGHSCRCANVIGNHHAREKMSRAGEVQTKDCERGKKYGIRGRDGIAAVGELFVLDFVASQD